MNEFGLEDIDRLHGSEQEKINQIKESIELDPSREIDQVKPSHLMNEKFPGSGNPPFNGGPDSLVCPEDSCHWQPCHECDPTRAQCRFAERHPIHLCTRSGFVVYKSIDTDMASGFRWVSEVCKCHPYRGGNDAAT